MDTMLTRPAVNRLVESLDDRSLRALAHAGDPDDRRAAHTELARRADRSVTVAACAGCGLSVPLDEDGALYAHRDQDGEDCPGAIFGCFGVPDCELLYTGQRVRPSSDFLARVPSRRGEEGVIVDINPVDDTDWPFLIVWDGLKIREALARGEFEVIR